MVQVKIRISFEGNDVVVVKPGSSSRVKLLRGGRSREL